MVSRVLEDGDAHSRLKPLPQTIYCHCARPLAKRASQAMEILRPFAAEAAPTDFLLSLWETTR